MKVPSLSGAGTLVSEQITRLKAHRFFADRLSVGILVLNLAMAIITLVILIVRVRPSEVPVPIHYSSLVGFDRLGPWWELYAIGLFSVLVTGVNTALAVMSFTRSRITSFFLMAGAFVVAIFALIISLAITAVV